ncbi:hypothetical protein BLNAU_3154 [Blattamonas nauphoetae]|uniref:RWD domain-containing protein n=1 Tax=Blattamonas nauphoetae TaxID=2049346 RepID=A0ABQ9YDA0_9EUKA|nr:hypothetical protein BLNAU_3154 [Blattamonas nauphoetae]
MSALGIDDELLAISILFPGYRPGDESEKYRKVEVFNQVEQIQYKINFTLEGYPEQPAKISISDFTSVGEGKVKQIETKANEMAASLAGEYCLCQILEDVHAQFQNLEQSKPWKLGGCGSGGCRCGSNSGCQCGSGSCSCGRI